MASKQIGNTRVDVYRVEESADEAFLHNLHRVGTLHKPAAIPTERQHQVQTIPRIKTLSRGTNFAAFLAQPTYAELANTSSASPSERVG